MGSVSEVSRNPVFRDGALHVCERKCKTCIFRPGNLMHLTEGRRESMEAEAVANESVIPCHKTLGPEAAVCRGYWDVHKRDVAALRLAVAMDLVVYDDPDRERAE